MTPPATSMSANEIIERLLSIPANPSKLTDDYGCAAICLVKDEAPYLHEYIHHHLYFGFARILILVNRTTDKSVSILNRIASVYPQVFHTNIDWVDAFGSFARFQNIGYAIGIRLLLTEGMVKYALFSDCDEFWFPKNFSTKVSEFIKQVPAFDMMSQTWVIQRAEEAPFEPPFFNQFADYPDGLVKSIVNLYSERRLLNMGAHAGKFSSRPVHIDSAGNPFRSKDGEAARFAGSAMKLNAHILHRMQRSENEYLATILRGRPGVDSPFKLNRAKYFRKQCPSMNLNKVRLSKYHASLRNFISECGIIDLLADARSARLSSEKQVFVALDDFFSGTHSKEIAEKLLRVLKGTKYQVFVEEAVRNETMK